MLVVGVISGQWLEKTIEVDSGPYAFCLVDDGEKLYCANRFSNKLTVIDPRTNEVSNVLETDSEPCALAWCESENKVYCANWGDRTVSVIDCVSDSIVATVRVGANPQVLLYNHQTNSIYCANTGYMPDYDSTVSVIDCVTDSVVSTIVVGATPRDMCMDVGTNRIYCASKYGDDVTIIDGAADTVVKSLLLGERYRPLRLQVCPEVRKVFVANFGHSTVASIDILGDSLLASIVTGDAPYSFGYDSTRSLLYCGTCRASGLYVVDASADSVVDSIDTRSGFSELLWNPITLRLYRSDMSEDFVQVVDPVPPVTVKNLTVGPRPEQLCLFRPLNRVFVACRTGRTIAVIRDNLRPGVEDERLEVCVERQGQTIYRGALMLRDRQDSDLLDITGRKVMELRPGENDIRHLAPGVYFIRRPETEGGRPSTSVRKVVIQR